MLRRRLAPLLLVLALVGAVAACGGDDGDKADSRSSSSTTQGTVKTDKASAEDLKLLLTKEDLDAAGLSGTTPSDVSNVPVQQNPDPRGPCGGKVSQPPLQHAYGRTFSSTNVVVVELVTPAGDTQTKYLDQIKQDIKPSCPSYQSKSAAGGDQTVSNIQVLALDDLGVPAVGWSQKIATAGQNVSGLVVTVVAGGKLAFVQAVSASDLTQEQATNLAKAAVTRLKG
jgi:hypothetical protein